MGPSSSQDQQDLEIESLRHELESLKRENIVLRTQESLYRSVVETQNELLCRYLPDTRLTFVNRAFATALNRSPEVLLTATLLDLLADQIPAYLVEYIQLATVDGADSRFEHPLTRIDGSIGWQEWLVEPIRDAEGRVVEFQAVGRDITQQKTAELELLQSQARLAETLQIAKLGRWSWSPLTSEVTWNDWMYAIFDIDPGVQPTLEQVNDRLHPDDRERAINSITARLDDNQKDYDLDYRVVHRNGDIRYIHAIVHLEYYAGIPHRVVGTAQDVTERRRLLKRLKTDEARLRMTLDIGQLIAWDWDLKSGLISLHQSDRPKLIGESQVMHEEWLGRIHSDDRAEVLAKVEPVLETPGGYQVEYRYQTPQYGERWLQTHGHSLVDYAGKINRVLGVSQDITDRKRSERKLRRSESRLRMAQRIAKVGSWEWSVQTGSVWWSDEMARVIGPGSECRPPTEWSSYLHSEDRQAFAADIQTALQKTDTHVFEHRFVLPNGDVRHIHCETQARRAPNGETVELIGTSQDVTERHLAAEERRTLEAQIQQAQKMESLGILAGGIAHDFNNLLVGVLGNAGLALAELNPRSMVYNTVEQIRISALRASDLTKQMLAYSGKGRFLIEPVDMSLLVHEMVHLLEVSISKSAQLVLSLSDTLPSAMVDATQIRQIVMNLITNASEALPDDRGVIRISTGAVVCDPSNLEGLILHHELAPGRFVYVEVRDSGIGMDIDTQSRIFDPFFTTKFAGRGLGMAAVLGIVRGHRGGIQLESSLGRGTTFRVLIPAMDERVESSGTRPIVQKPPQGEGLVLVVDDDPAVRNIARRVLERSGFEVVAVSGGAEAVRRFERRAEEFSVVLLDLTMPQMDGKQTYRALAEIRAGFPVVISSGYSHSEATTVFGDSSLFSFVQKPYQPQDLVRAIQDAILLT